MNEMMERIDESRARRKGLRRVLVMVLLVSVIVHLLAGIGAGIWVIARYFRTPQAQFVVAKPVQIAAEDRQHRMGMDETTSLRPRPVYDNRIQSLRPSPLALPDLPRVPLETVAPIDVEALVSDQVNGMGSRRQESRGVDGFFGGGGDPKSGLLQGHLYDLKQTERGEPVEMNDEKYLEIIGRLSRASGADPLARFFKAPQPLYLSRLAIPMLQSTEAPKAFAVDGRVAPQYWVVIYQGRAVAPKSGTFKFLGYGDDILLVKVNGRLVFDGSNLGATRLHNREGVSFTVNEGEAYDIELVIGECPGTFFGAWLQVQEQGTGEKPYWFRMGADSVRFQKTNVSDRHRMPDEMIDGPIWLPAPMQRSGDSRRDAAGG